MFLKRKNEPTLKTFLDELICSDNAVTIDKINPIRVHLTFIVEEAKWATIQYLYEKNDTIDECLFIVDDIGCFH